MDLRKNCARIPLRSVCVGVSFALTNEQNYIVTNVDVPLAFECAIVGMLIFGYCSDKKFEVTPSATELK